jgi:glutathione S-transferase
MPRFTLVIGNKNYSSWSLRAWLVLKAAQVEFDEVVIPLDQPQTNEQILRHSPSGKVPALIEGDLTIWDSLAIAEYLAESFPAARLWPSDVRARAVARSVSAEMHSGFAALRQNMPMNARASFPGRGLAPGVQEDINRIAAIWRDCSVRFGEAAGGHFLFGSFTVADAMFAPVVSRFRTYQVALDSDAQRYVDAVWNLPALQQWVEGARREPWMNEKYEF